jgi:hypothetical protein
MKPRCILVLLLVGGLLGALPGGAAQEAGRIVGGVTNEDSRAAPASVDARAAYRPTIPVTPRSPRGDVLTCFR